MVDPNYEILRWTEAFREKAGAVAPYTHGDVTLQYGKNEEAAADFDAALSALQPGKDHFALRFRLVRGLGDVASEQEKWDVAISRYCEAAALRPRAEEQMPELWQSLAQAWLREGEDSRSMLSIREAAASIRRL